MFQEIIFRDIFSHMKSWTEVEREWKFVRNGTLCCSSIKACEMQYNLMHLIKRRKTMLSSNKYAYNTHQHSWYCDRLMGKDVKQYDTLEYLIGWNQFKNVQDLKLVFVNAQINLEYQTSACGTSQHMHSQYLKFKWIVNSFNGYPVPNVYVEVCDCTWTLDLLA